MQVFGAFASGAAAPGWRESAFRLTDIIVAGLKAAPRAAGP